MHFGSYLLLISSLLFYLQAAGQADSTQSKYDLQVFTESSALKKILVLSDKKGHVFDSLEICDADPYYDSLTAPKDSLWLFFFKTHRNDDLVLIEQVLLEAREGKIWVLAMLQFLWTDNVEISSTDSLDHHWRLTYNLSHYNPRYPRKLHSKRHYNTYNEYGEKYQRIEDVRNLYFDSTEVVLYDTIVPVESHYFYHDYAHNIHEKVYVKHKDETKAITTLTQSIYIHLYGDWYSLGGSSLYPGLGIPPSRFTNNNEMQFRLDYQHFWNSNQNN